MLQTRQAGVVSNSRNKIHQTQGPPFSRALYKPENKAIHLGRLNPVPIPTGDIETPVEAAGGGRR